MDAQPWFCPTCNAYHAPHVETCPKFADAIASEPYQPLADPLPTHYVPNPAPTAPVVPDGHPGCQRWRCRQGLAYPRTCQDCGLSGPCRHGLPSLADQKRRAEEERCGDTRWGVVL